MILGRGAFAESFPPFGFGLADYETLLEEKLDLFATILAHDGKSEPVSWTGTTRAPLKGQRLFPPTESGTLRAGHSA